MDMGPLIFFTFVGAIIIVPQVLRYRERAHLLEALKIAFERGQPAPPELLAALQPRRGRGGADWSLPPEAAGWRMQTAAAPSPGPAAPFSDPTAATAAPSVGVVPPILAPVFPSQTRRDLRRGVIWLAVGLGLLAAGGASYAGLYEVGGAQETLSLFAAFAAVPILVGLTYLALSWAGREKSRS